MDDSQGVAAMAQISDAVQHSVKRFLEAVSRERRVAAAYIYGSEARQQATQWSDIDVAVISPDFADDLFAAQVALEILPTHFFRKVLLSISFQEAW